MKARRVVLLTLGVIAVMCLLVGSPSGAITFGEPDGERHPNVGALLADWNPDSPGPDIRCTGTLIAPDVFLTAGHCTSFLADQGISEVWVTFVPEYDEDAEAPEGTTPGTYVTHPDFGYSGHGGSSEPHDQAVVLLDRDVDIAPADLPTAGLLDELRTSGELRDASFTTVGYGATRIDKTGGPNGVVFDWIRRFTEQTYKGLQTAWLDLSMQPSTGDGGACFADSGGPHFLGGADSNLLVSLTAAGDAACRSLDKTSRLDTPAARAFLGQFVDLP